MIRFFLLRIVLPLILFLILRSVLKSIFGSARSSVTEHPKSGPSVRAGGELKKDPVCGTFVSPEASVTRNIHGELVYFCSKACRDKYSPA